MSQNIDHDFTATGESPTGSGQTGSFAVTGTFVGTVALQHRINNEWVDVAEYTAATTTSDDTAFDFGAITPIRFECTAYTSGTIEVNLVAR